MTSQTQYALLLERLYCEACVAVFFLFETGTEAADKGKVKNGAKECSRHGFDDDDDAAY